MPAGCADDTGIGTDRRGGLLSFKLDADADATPFVTKSLDRDASTSMGRVTLGSANLANRGGAASPGVASLDSRRPPTRSIMEARRDVVDTGVVDESPVDEWLLDAARVAATMQSCSCDGMSGAERYWSAHMADGDKKCKC